ncbi:MAG: FAD-dependent oxidoreductase [Clostridioides sp.]|jgi:rubredoxin|nr:FAD-dependent oxidoreductase [Clostridioides sp.]
MKKWKCKVCGYIHDGEMPPEVCPVCGAGKESFVLVDEVGNELSEPHESEESFESQGLRQSQELEEDKYFSLEADVLVVGSGAAAFSGAVTARENGASVIMLEKAKETGGTTARSGGGFWTPLNRWQKENGYEDNREDALRYMARYSYPNLYNSDAEYFGIPKSRYELMEAYVDNASDMATYFDEIGALHSIGEINWTGNAQVDYMDHLIENKGIRGRTLYPRDEDGKIKISGAELIRQMEKWSREHGVEIITGCEVVKINQGDTGKVIGIEAIINDKRYIFKANKGVIFGSGGYSHNADLMLQWQRGPHYGGCSVPTNTGDLVRISGNIGAQMGNTPGAFRAQSMIEAYLENPGGSSNVFYVPGDSMFIVNKYGERIVDEKRNYTDRTMIHFVWDPERAEWKNMLTFMLFDSRCATIWQGYPPFPIAGQHMPYLIKGDSFESLEKEIRAHLKEIGEHTGGFELDDSFTENLKDTIEKFNGYARSGDDKDFNRGNYTYDREWTTFPPTVPGVQWPPEDSKNITMYPIGEGPYYAIILAAGTLDTNGGPVIDSKGRILDWSGNPIEGLYGAGNCIASPTANAYWGAGSTIGPAMTFGYISAHNCLKL